MSAVQSHRVSLALAWLARTGCTAAKAAARYKVARSSVTRAMRRSGLPVAPRGRPRKVDIPL